jgi:hypothetical protein
VLHIAQGGASGSIGWLTNPASQVSSHFFITKSGQIYQLVAITDTAWANGLRWAGQWLTPTGKPVKPRWPEIIRGKNPNGYTISIEHEGKSGESLTQAMVEAQNKLLIWIAQQLDWSTYAAGKNLIGHGDINPVDKPFCPGKAFDLGIIAIRASQGLAPTADRITEDASIIAPARATPEQMIARIVGKPHGEYALFDIDTIVRGYFGCAQPVGVDPLVCIAQMIHETGNLTSYWSQRPRRNPAGIGVTGAPGAGVSFDSWVDDAIPAHVGRLLAYALPVGAGTPAQKELITLAMGYRLLPDKCRGSAPTLRLLGSGPNKVDGCGWAGDGDGEGQSYGARIAAIMNQIRGL